MKMTRPLPTIAALLIVGCAAPVQEQQLTTFLSGYSSLEKVDDQTYNFVGSSFDDYDAFMIDPVGLLFERPDDPIFTDEQIDDLKEYTVDALARALTRGDHGFAIVSEAGPRVGRVRIGITQLEETIGALNLSSYTKAPVSAAWPLRVISWTR